jgi:hypothetical protein
MWMWIWMRMEYGVRPLNSQLPFTRQKRKERDETENIHQHQLRWLSLTVRVDCVFSCSTFFGRLIRFKGKDIAYETYCEQHWKR